MKLILPGRVPADDFTDTHLDGAIDTKESCIGNLKSGKSKYLKLDHPEIKVQQLPKDPAITIARASVVTVSNGKESPANLSLLHVFVKRGGRWQMVAHQICEVQQDLPPGRRGKVRAAKCRIGEYGCPAHGAPATGDRPRRASV